MEVKCESVPLSMFDFEKVGNLSTYYATQHADCSSNTIRLSIDMNGTWIIFKSQKNPLAMPSNINNFVSHLVLIVARHLLCCACLVPFLAPCLWPLAKLGDPTISDLFLCNYWILCNTTLDS